MGRARTKPRNVRPLRPRGRPPLPPRTQLAKWMRSREMTTAELHGQLVDLAPTIGVPDACVPGVKTLQDTINARHWPSAPTMLLVRHATSGAIDLEHWVADLAN